MTAAQSANSKAAKVESAIEYIKQLQKEVSERDKLLSQKDQEMGALRKELEALKKGDTPSVAESSNVGEEQMKKESTGSPEAQTT